MRLLLRLLHLLLLLLGVRLLLSLLVSLLLRSLCGSAASSCPVSRQALQLSLLPWRKGLEGQPLHAQEDIRVLCAPHCHCARLGASPAGG